MFFKTNKRIREIIDKVNKISQGGLEQRIPVLPRDTIGILAESLNAAVAYLKDSIFKLEKENRHIQAILNNMVEGVIAIDKDTRILSINPTVEKVFDISKRQAEGVFFLEAIRNNDIAETINQVLKNGEFISKELSLVWPVHKTFQINASPLFEKEKVNGCLLVIHDITELRRLETMRRDLVANVSHELKTPLTSIKGFVETLLEGALEDKDNARHFLTIVQDHANRLDNLVNDLLSLSYLESREAVLKKEPVGLKDVVEDILSGFKSQLKRKSIEVKNDLASGIFVTADKDKLWQVITNLIDNAIKFNKEKGEVRIYAQWLNGDIKVVVEDSGCGIPPKDLSRVFERFYRVDKARSHELGGTGLGLSIVKHIVELHGGSVGVESTEGLGSNFWFILPK